MKSRKQSFEGNGAAVKANLQAQGLLDQQGKVTPQGEQWTKDLMARYAAATRQAVREMEDA